MTQIIRYEGVFVCSVLPDKYRDTTLTLHQYRLLQSPFQFIIHCHPIVSSAL